MSLTPKQRKYLKGLAHPLSPVVRVGRPGVRASMVEETKRSLQSHELIKVRIESDDGALRKQLAQELATAAEAELAGAVGKIVILYRKREEKPEIVLPK